MHKEIKLILGVHNHQPVGNFDGIFEEVYEKAYKPFIDVLSKFPDIKITYHISGPLLKWLINKKPEFIEKLKNMVKTEQIEIMSGGFYEPILTVIPDRDKINQIKTYNEFLYKIFNFQPSGFWLTERVWEPHLAKFIGESGLKYTVVDDYHFKSAGLNENELYGYYTTEDQNVSINVFPISERLRYYIPFRIPAETINFLKSIASNDGKRIITIVDDGEKFGSWPKTYKWVYEEMWLHNFFTALSENKNFIKTVTFKEVLSEILPINRFYLPAASYEEMMEWSLTASAAMEYQKFVRELKESDKYDNFGRFVKGGFWRNYLFKYPESNNMQKKSFYVSDKVNSVKDKDRKIKAQDELFQGQCNCAYWHGIFGGLYLKHLRNAVYNHLLQAEKIADSCLKSKKEWIEVERKDFDLDGKDEVLVSSDSLNVYFNENYGGSIFELDFKEKNINLIDTLARREEAYHSKIREIQKLDKSKIASIHDIPIEFNEKDIDKALRYDWYRKISLLDHFFEENTTIDSFRYVSYHELGDFVNQPYKANILSSNDEVTIELTRCGALWKNGNKFPVKVAKKVKIISGSNKLDISYTIENKFKEKLNLWFGTEFNVSLPSTENKVEVKKTKEITLTDKYIGFEVNISSDREVEIWHFPVQTVSQAIGKLEKVYQSSVILFNWKFSLSPSEKFHINLTKKIKSL